MVVCKYLGVHLTLDGNFLVLLGFRLVLFRYLLFILGLLRLFRGDIGDNVVLL